MKKEDILWDESKIGFSVNNFKEYIRRGFRILPTSSQNNVNQMKGGEAK